MLVTTDWLETVGSLPTHALAVHLVVVGIPAAALASVAVASRSTWRRRFGWPVAVVNVLLAVVTQLTAVAGDALLVRSAPTPRMLAHAELGATVPLLVGALALASIVVAVADRIPVRWLPVLAAVLVVAAGAVATVQTVRAGHSGAASVWGGQWGPVLAEDGKK